MNQLLPLLLAVITGVLLGVMFYAGLWWTVRISLASAHPASWLFASLLLRMGSALAGLYLVAASDWRRLLACLVGFLAARAVVTWLTRPAAGAAIDPAVAVRHAS